MCSEASVPKLVNEMVRTFNAVYGDAVKEIYLYGSYARGDYTAQSDIDFVAIVEGDRKELQEKLKKVWDRSSELSIDYDIVVSPTVIPFSEFESYCQVLPYYRNILQEGKLVG